MSTPTESETSESETRTRAYVALYAVVNDHVDPVDRDEYFARHVRYLEELDQAGHVLLAGSFTDLGNTLDGFALYATPDEDEGAEARRRGSGCGTVAERDGTQLDRPSWR